MNEEEYKQKMKASIDSIKKYAKVVLPSSSYFDDAIKSARASNKKYTKQEIMSYLEAPAKNEEKLIQVVDYLVSISPQFQKLCNYLPNIALIRPVVVPNTLKYKTNNTIKNTLMLLNGTRKNIDVCLINDNPFVYVACIGAWVDISYATPRKLKEKYGKLAYVIYGIKQLKQHLQFYKVKYTVNGETHEDEFSFIFITNSNRVGGVNNIYNDVKLDDNKFEVLLCNIKNKWDIIRAVHYLNRRELNNIPVFKYYKTDNIKFEFDEVPPSWCIDGDELLHNDKKFEIKINKDNYMLLPTKNIGKLFEQYDKDEDL